MTTIPKEPAKRGRSLPYNERSVSTGSQRIAGITINASIDIIVTAHNMQDCLDECLTSLAAQTHSDFRVFIIEDGSTDQTATRAQNFAEHDQRFHVISTPGLGAAGARNHGLALVEAPAFMLLDGDDIFHPTMLSRLLSAMNSTDADVVVCDMVQFVHDTTRPHAHRERVRAPWSLKKSQLPHLGSADWLAHPWVNERTIPGNLFAAFMGWPWDKLYKTSFIRQHGLSFPEDLTNSEDMLFTYEALVLASRIAVVDEVLIDHRIERGGSVSNSRTSDPLAFYVALSRMKSFLKNRLQNAWERLQKPFLNWAFDWTLWNIETLGESDEQSRLIHLLHDNAFDLLELTEHDPAYFSEYPRSLARYASLLDDEAARTPGFNPNTGPLGALNALPYGAFKPWSQANIFEKLQIKHRMRQNIPSEW